MNLPVMMPNGFNPFTIFMATHPNVFFISDVHFVFSTSQYLKTYNATQSEIFRKVFEGYLANPMHVALYIGCSFTDKEMNNLLKSF